MKSKSIPITTCSYCKKKGLLGSQIEVFYIGRFSGRIKYRDLHNNDCSRRWHEKFRRHMGW